MSRRNNKKHHISNAQKLVRIMVNNKHLASVINLVTDTSYVRDNPETLLNENPEYIDEVLNFRDTLTVFDDDLEVVAKVVVKALSNFRSLHNNDHDFMELLNRVASIGEDDEKFSNIVDDNYATLSACAPVLTDDDAYRVSIYLTLNTVLEAIIEEVKPETDNTHEEYQEETDMSRRHHNNKNQNTNNDNFDFKALLRENPELEPYLDDPYYRESIKNGWRPNQFTPEISLTSLIANATPGGLEAYNALVRGDSETFNRLTDEALGRNRKVEEPVKEEPSYPTVEVNGNIYTVRELPDPESPVYNARGELKAHKVKRFYFDADGKQVSDPKVIEQLAASSKTTPTTTEEVINENMKFVMERAGLNEYLNDKQQDKLIKYVLDNKDFFEAANGNDVDDEDEAKLIANAIIYALKQNKGKIAKLAQFLQSEDCPDAKSYDVVLLADYLAEYANGTPVPDYSFDKEAVRAATNEAKKNIETQEKTEMDTTTSANQEDKVTLLPAVVDATVTENDSLSIDNIITDVISGVLTKLALSGGVDNDTIKSLMQDLASNKDIDKNIDSLIETVVATGKKGIVNIVKALGEALSDIATDIDAGKYDTVVETAVAEKPEQTEATVSDTKTTASTQPVETQKPENMNRNDVLFHAFSYGATPLYEEDMPLYETYIQYEALHGNKVERPDTSKLIKKPVAKTEEKKVNTTTQTKTGWVNPFSKLFATA